MPSSFMRILSVICFVLLTVLPQMAAAQDTNTEGTSSGPDVFFSRIEKITGQKLSTIEEKLQQHLEKTEPPFTDRLRDRLINLSMWGLLAGCSQWTLETLGDSQVARYAFFFGMPFVRWMSSPFIFPVETEGADAQKEVSTVFELISRLRAAGFGVSLDNVGDASLSPEDARRYRHYYLTLIDQFVSDGSIPELAMSLKLSALVHNLEAAVGDGPSKDKQLKRDELKSALLALLAAARKSPKRVFIRIDMEEYLFKDMTLELFREMVEENPALIRNTDGSLRLGVVIQAYLRDSGKDMVELCKWAKAGGFRVPVRLVKGAYLVHEREEARKEGRKSPVWNFKPSTDANYESICAFMLLNKDSVQPAFATHNIRSMAHVMALAQMLGFPDDSIELQMLYGMGDPIKDIVISMGYSMREYIPAGSFARGLKYAGRRFRELANSDNALARTMRGDFSSADGTAPAFQGAEDMQDGKFIRQAVGSFLSSH